MGVGALEAESIGEEGWSGEVCQLDRPLPLRKSKVEARRGGVKGVGPAGLTALGHWPLGPGSMRTLDSLGRQNGGRVGVDDGAPSPEGPEQGLLR